MSQAAAGSPLSPETLVKALRSQLFPEREAEAGIRTYAVLDGASMPDLLDHLYANPRPEFVCLYRGDLEPDMAEVAPYLVRLEPKAAFTDWLFAEGWGDHCGIFARTRMELKAVRKHLRGFLMVLTPESKRVYFRYYDPRVLPHFLPTCNAFQLQRVFGPVSTYLCEGDSAAEIVCHRFDGEKLTIERIDLGKASSGLAAATAATIRPAEQLADRDRQEIHMRIRQEQVDALAAPRRAQLPRKIVRFLREECPKQVQVMDDAQLETFALEQMNRAARHRVEVEWDVCRFCWLAALHGLRFDDECDWARTVLAAADTGTERMDLLENYQRNHLEPMFNPA